MNEMPGKYRPDLRIYHANGKGTGCALKLNLHPAHDDSDGCIMAVFANQISVGDRNLPAPTFSRFDWENAIAVKLDFNDLCRMLQVFRGECESIEDGRGLYHVSAKANTVINLRHTVEPVSGYMFEVSRSMNDGGAPRRAHILLAKHEALGIAESIAGSLAVVSFGIPMLVPHDTSAYKAEARRAANAGAAA
jgi:hypothetical protein